MLLHGECQMAVAARKCARTVLGENSELLIIDHPIARSQAELQALPDSPRDVVGDIRVCRFLRFHGGKVPEAQPRGGKPGNLMVCYRVYR